MRLPENRAQPRLSAVLSDEQGLNLIQSIVPVSRETEQRLVAYHQQLRKWQQRINLISPATLDSAWKRHFADSAQCFTYAKSAKHWVDIGSGAGFPGLVIAILLADGSVDDNGGCVELIETNGKKCAFLAHVIRETGLSGTGVAVKVHKARVEDIIHGLEIPDVVTARALSSLDNLLAMTVPLLTNGATGLFPKGRDHENELTKARDKWAFTHVNHPSRFENGSVVTEIRHLTGKV